jgi:hypothetical protein
VFIPSYLRLGISHQRLAGQGGEPLQIGLNPEVGRQKALQLALRLQVLLHQVRLQYTKEDDKRQANKP